MCDMVKPAFIPPADIHHLRDLIRYRFKLTCMLTDKKNHAQNYLTVPNLKLEDVFSYVSEKYSYPTTEHILKHPGETFDVTPFVDGRLQILFSEIQTEVDSAISLQQAVKLRQSLYHIDELKKHRAEIKQEILRLSHKYKLSLNLIRTVP